VEDFRSREMRGRDSKNGKSKGSGAAASPVGYRISRSCEMPGFQDKTIAHTHRPMDLKFEDIIAAAEALRDRELLGQEKPLKLSWVKRQKKKMALAWLGVLGLWIAGIFGEIAVFRPLMVGRSGWWAVPFLLSFFASTVLVNFGLYYVARGYGMNCPYCGATFMYYEFRSRRGKPPARSSHRCTRCHALMIDESPSRPL
jgi:hypothetical protein